MTRSYIPVLTIAGSDSSGGAGIQADIKTMSALGAYAASVITAVTAQNTLGVTAVESVSPEVIGKQIDAVMTDICPRAVKIGMIGNATAIETIAQRLATYPDVPLVVDPVMVATSGSRLTEDSALPMLIDRLIPMATLITPNLPEAERLVGHLLGTREEWEDAALRMLDMGCKAVLIKGGHNPEGDTMTDRLYRFDADGKLSVSEFSHPRIHSVNTHGTGCTLSSAIATCLAKGLPLYEAVEQSVSYLARALEQGKDITVGHGHGPVNHLFDPQPLIVEEERSEEEG